jgi:hypothetical protein
MFVSKKKYDNIVWQLHAANKTNEGLIAELQKFEFNKVWSKEPVKKVAKKTTTKAPAKKKETK